MLTCFGYFFANINIFWCYGVKQFSLVVFSPVNSPIISREVLTPTGLARFINYGLVPASSHSTCCGDQFQPKPTSLSLFLFQLDLSKQHGREVAELKVGLNSISKSCYEERQCLTHFYFYFTLQFLQQCIYPWMLFK